MSFHPSVCPHDCPSVCALEVERLPDGRLGKVRGAERNTYTAGVICAKVARYHERYHHRTAWAPAAADRSQGLGQFAGSPGRRRWTRSPRTCCGASARHGAEAVWPYFYAGTMGLVQRDGIERLPTSCNTRASRARSASCSARPAAWPAHGKRWGVTRDRDRPAVRPGRDLGRQPGPHPGQHDDPHRPRPEGARRQAGRGRPLPHRHGGAGRHAPGAAAGHRRGAGLRGDACAVPDGYADRDYLARYSDVPDELEGICARARRTGPRPSPACRRPRSGLRPALRRTKRAFLRLGYGFTRSRNGAAAMHAATCLPVGDRRLAARRAAARSTISATSTTGTRRLIEGLDAATRRPRARPVADRPDPGRRPRRPGRRRAGPRAADPEHQPDVRRTRPAARCTAASRATTCSSRCTSSS